MHSILSIFVSLAMLFSGATALPAEPQAQTAWTLSDVVYSENGETIALNPSARLTAALGKDRIQLQFEMENGGKTLMPAAGEITPEGLRFRLGQSGTVYEIAGEALMDALNADEYTPSVLDALDSLLSLEANYFPLLRRCTAEPEYLWSLTQRATEALVQAAGATPEAGEIEIDGQRHPVETVTFDMDGAVVYAALDAVDTSADPMLEGLLDSGLRYVSFISDTDYDSFSAALADYAASAADVEGSYSDPAFPVALQYSFGDALNYLSLSGAPDADDHFRYTVCAADDWMRLDAEYVVNSVFGDAQNTLSNASSIQMNLEVNGPMRAPASVKLNFDRRGETNIHRSLMALPDGTIVGPYAPDSESAALAEPLDFESRSNLNASLRFDLIQGEGGLYSGALRRDILQEGSQHENGEMKYTSCTGKAAQVDVDQRFDEAGARLTELRFSSGASDMPGPVSALERDFDLDLRRHALENGDFDLSIEFSDPANEEYAYVLAIARRAQSSGVRYGVEFSGGTDGERGSISFKLSRSEAPFANVLSGNALDAGGALRSMLGSPDRPGALPFGEPGALPFGEPGANQAMLRLSADALRFGADASALMADPSVQAIVRFISEGMVESEAAPEETTAASNAAIAAETPAPDADEAGATRTAANAATDNAPAPDAGGMDAAHDRANAPDGAAETPAPAAIG